MREVGSRVHLSVFDLYVAAASDLHNAGLDLAKFCILWHFAVATCDRAPRGRPRLSHRSVEPSGHGLSLQSSL